MRHPEPKTEARFQYAGQLIAKSGESEFERQADLFFALRIIKSCLRAVMKPCLLRASIFKNQFSLSC